MSFTADGRVRNHTAFGEYLHSFLADNLDIFPGFGWLDGGCLALAQAMRVWGPGMFEPIAWVSWLNDSPQSGADWHVDDNLVLVQHYAVTHRCEDLIVVIDGDGVGTIADFETKMIELECRQGFIHPDAGRLIDTSNERSEFEVCLDQASPYISEIVNRLRREFGDFCPSLLSIDMPSKRPSSMTI